MCTDALGGVTYSLARDEEFHLEPCAFIMSTLKFDNPKDRIHYLKAPICDMIMSSHFIALNKVGLCF